jgi:hypothetical protein
MATPTAWNTLPQTPLNRTAQEVALVVVSYLDLL